MNNKEGEEGLRDILWVDNHVFIINISVKLLTDLYTGPEQCINILLDLSLGQRMTW